MGIDERCLTFDCTCIQVLEIRPTIKWDKGKALEFLLESLGEFEFNKIYYYFYLVGSACLS